MCEGSCDWFDREIEQRMRDVVGKYCVSSCDAHCCRSGMSVEADDFEARKVLGENYMDRVLVGRKKKYKIVLNPCVQLREDGLCGIFGEEGRPAGCCGYPIAFEREGVVVDDGCLAVQAGVLDEYIRTLDGMGVEVIGGRERVVLRRG